MKVKINIKKKGGILIMLGLGLLVFGAMLGGSAILCGIDNAKMKSKPYRHLDDGTPVYLDRLCNEYANGEKIVPHLDYNTMKMTYVGQSSGKVYIDPEQNTRNRLDGWSEKHKQEAISKGELAYMRYNHAWERELTCEVATDRFIAYLEGREDGTYWKYYDKNDSPKFKTQAYIARENKLEPPVQITQDEYDRLNIYMGTHEAYDSNRYTCRFRKGKIRYELRYEPLVAKEDLPKVPGRN